MQFDASSRETPELGFQGVDSAINGHAKSQRPVGLAQSHKELGVTDPGDQDLPVCMTNLHACTVIIIIKKLKHDVHT